MFIILTLNLHSFPLIYEENYNVKRQTYIHVHKKTIMHILINKTENNYLKTNGQKETNYKEHNIILFKHSNN